MRYAVMFQIEQDEWVYASGENPFTSSSPILTFNTHEAASEVAEKYNTGIVVQQEGELREFDRSERGRSVVRSLVNGRS